MTRLCSLVFLLALAGCDFGGRLTDFCASTGRCDLDGNPVCQKLGGSCAASSCCDGLVCVDLGAYPYAGQELHQKTCYAPTAALRVTSVTPVDFGDQAVGSTSASRQVEIVNDGRTATQTLNVTTSGDADQFVVDASACAGQALATDGICHVLLHASPKAAGTFAAKITVGDGATSVEIDVSERGL
jgi:hypothetical protein